MRATTGEGQGLARVVRHHRLALSRGMDFIFWLLVSVVFLILIVVTKNPRQARALGGALFCSVILTLDAAARRWAKKNGRR